MIEEASGSSLAAQERYSSLKPSEKELLNSLVQSQKQQGDLKELKPVRFILRNIKERPRSSLLR